MKRIYAADITPKLDNKEVFLQGWIHEIRDLSKVKFIILRDDSGLIQLIIKDKSDIIKLPKESIIEVSGIVIANKQAPNGVEVIIKKYKVLSEAEQNLPIQVVEKGKIETNLAKRLDFRSIDLRKPKVHAIFKIQAALVEGMQEYLQKENFTQVFTPCIMGTASESGAEVFPIVYYNKEAFLRQDPQLHRQLTILGGIEKLYDIGPSWRAEVSHTTKHLSEHRTCAVEFAFIKDEIDVERVEEQLIISALKKVKEKCNKELKLFNIDITIPKAPFPELRFPEIYDILKKLGKKINYGDDIDSEAEKLLNEYVKKKYKSEFYFINRFPSKIKPFYVMKVDETPEWARSIDLYYNGLELSSGGQREHRYGKLMQHVKEKGMKLENIEWFIKFFKYGVPSHGGFAIGIERLTQMLLNLENVREAVLFPRDPERLTP